MANCALLRARAVERLERSLMDDTSCTDSTCLCFTTPCSTCAQGEHAYFGEDDVIGCGDEGCDCAPLTDAELAALLETPIE